MIEDTERRVALQVVEAYSRTCLQLHLLAAALAPAEAPFLQLDVQLGVQPLAHSSVQPWPPPPRGGGVRMSTYTPAAAYICKSLW